MIDLNTVSYGWRKVGCVNNTDLYIARGFTTGDFIIKIARDDCLAYKVYNKDVIKILKEYGLHDLAARVVADQIRNGS